jgi:hypothetical protein
MVRPFARSIAAAAGILLLAGAAQAQTISSALAGQSAAAGGQYGWSVNDAGDLNRDGYPDLILGAPLDSRSGQNRGRAYIFFGGTQERLELQGSASQGTQENFGWDVAGIGDFNNDGFDDVAVGAPKNSALGQYVGRVYVFYGGTNMNAVADLQLNGEISGDHFGWAVSRAGDLNGDGIDDLLVGAPLANTPSADAGGVYLFLGSSGTPSTTYARRFNGEVGGDQFGYDVSDVPDYMGNGTPAFVVGAPYKDQPISNGGRGYLFFGRTNGTVPDNTPDVIFEPRSGDPAELHLGWSVSQAGFFNADSRTDVVLGAPGYNGSTGLVAVFYGESSPQLEPTAGQVIVGQQGGDEFGYAVADAGDFEGSNRTEIVVGARLRPELGSEAGMAYLFTGGSTYTAAVQGTKVQRSGLSAASPAGDRLGSSVSYAGDMDGDGQDDFAIGAPTGNNLSGAVTGYVGIVSSSGNPVPVIPVRMEQRLGLGERVELRFSGPVVDAREASLWTAGGYSLLAELGAGLEPLDGGLVAEFERQQLQGMVAVELRWTSLGGVSQVENFALQAWPALSFLLHEPVPNPFNPSTVVSFELAEAARVRLRVVDSRGRTVRTLFEGLADSGRFEQRFDGRDDRGRSLSSGVYSFVLEGGRQRASVRGVLIK